MISIRGLSKSFGDREVLKDLNLEVEHGRVLAILGPSGSGKTTLLRSLNALERPEKGTVDINGNLVNFGEAPGEKDLVALRKRSTMVFQDFNLFPHMTALQNVTEGLITVKKRSPDEARVTAEALLSRVGLGDRMNAYPAMLSGGQKQRVAIARALAMEPEIILFDEPTSALDIELVDGILRLIRDLAAEGRTMMIVTHEIGFALQLADRILFMDQGVVLDDLTPEEIRSGRGSRRLSEFLSLVS